MSKVSAGGVAGKRRETRPKGLACLTCFSRKVKCDGGQPCSACTRSAHYKGEDTSRVVCEYRLEQSTSNVKFAPYAKHAQVDLHLPTRSAQQAPARLTREAAFPTFDEAATSYLPPLGQVHGRMGPLESLHLLPSFGSSSSGGSGTSTPTSFFAPSPPASPASLRPFEASLLATSHRLSGERQLHQRRSGVPIAIPLPPVPTFMECDGSQYDYRLEMLPPKPAIHPVDYSNLMPVNTPFENLLAKYTAVSPFM